MKKKLFSVIALAAVAVSAVVLAKLPILQKDKSEVITLQNYAVPAGEVEINETNFPDENFRKIVSGCDKDNSGGLSTSEISQIKEFGVNDPAVTSIKGIEFFTELSTLYLQNAQFTEVDISKNENLRYFLCWDTNLKSLDISQNTKIEDVECTNNPLTSLIVGENPSLWYLDCSYCDLKTVDLSMCSTLSSFVCVHSQLNELKLGSNKVLKNLHIAYNPDLKEVDVHLCPEIVRILTNYRHSLFFDPDNHLCYDVGPNRDLFFDKGLNFITTGPSVGKVTGLKAVSAGRNKVKLNWNAVEGAEGYLVYAQKDKKYAYVGMTTKGTTFTDTKALDSDYNYYWVFAYVKDIDGSLVPGGCEKYVYAKGVCLAVTNLKAASQTGSVKLSWTASAGAEGYLIYGIRPGGSYGYIGMTTKGTTFTDTKASKTDYTFYWVFPYHKDADGTMIVGGTAKYTYGKAR